MNLKQRRKEESHQETGELNALQNRRDKDLETMQARRKRFEAHLAKTREESERALAEQKKMREQQEERMAAEEEGRRKLAEQTSAKYQDEDEARSFREENRRKQLSEESSFAEKDQLRLKKFAEEKQARQKADEENAEAERQGNAAGMFGKLLLLSSSMGPLPFRINSIVDSAVCFDMPPSVPHGSITRNHTHKLNLGRRGLHRRLIQRYAITPFRSHAGTKLRKSGQDFTDHVGRKEFHPMVGIMGKPSPESGRKGGLTNLCKPPDTRM